MIRRSNVEVGCNSDYIPLCELFFRYHLVLFVCLLLFCVVVFLLLFFFFFFGGGGVTGSTCLKIEGRYFHNPRFHIDIK